MLNDGPLSRFEPLGGGLLKPHYDGHSFANIANTIEFMLTGDRRGTLLPADCFGGTYPRPQKTVLFFIDAFGWEFWMAHWQRFRTTQRVVKDGTLTPISALFPSTTAASVATLNLGVLPAQHAFFEWNLYVPAYGEVIQSLPFSPLGKRVTNGCAEANHDPNHLFAVSETIHQRLARHGVRSLLFSHKGYAGSQTNSIMNAGAEIACHGTLAEALVQLKVALTQTEGKAAFNLYWGAIDTIGHMHGPGTAYHDAEIASFWRTFDDVFRDIDVADTLFMFTADHGQIYANPANTLFINEAVPELSGCLTISPTGIPIFPSGSPRDMFLHTKPERHDETLALLHRHFDDMAMIMPIGDALEHGLFGPLPIGAELRARLGDILILPYAGNFMWWHDPTLTRNAHRGHHGGLSAEELITAFGVIDRL